MGLRGLAAALTLVGLACADPASWPEPSRATETASLAPPAVGQVELRVLAPSVLEVSAVVDPGDGTGGDPFVGPDGQPALVAQVLASGRVHEVGRTGLRRRVRYAPLARRDLRVETTLVLELAAPLDEGSEVEVRLEPWPTALPPGALIARVDPERVSPVLHVSQAGYLPELPKRVPVGAYLGTLGELEVGARPFEVRPAGGGPVALRGALRPRPDQGFPGSPYRQVLEADLDALTEAGEWELVVPGLGRSQPFRVHEGAAALWARTHALGLYHQRCGEENALPFTRFAHGACHLQPVEVAGEGSASVAGRLRSWTERVPGNPNHPAPRLDSVARSLFPARRPEPRPVVGGHHDAGDYGRYTFNASLAVHHLVFAVDALPGVDTLDNLGLPESGDGVPDLLQEALREAELLLQLQDDDGAFFSVVQPRDRPYETDVLPDHGDPQVLFPKGTQATAAATAALAQLASSPVARRHAPQTAARSLEAARRGWAFLESAWQRHGRAGAYQTVHHYGTTFEDRDEVAWAATEVFLATGNAHARAVMEEYAPGDPATLRWGFQHAFEGYGAAARSGAFAARSGRERGAAIAAARRAACEGEVLAAGRDQAEWAAQSAYGLSLPLAGKRIQRAGWIFAEDALFDLVVARALRPDPAFDEAIASNLAYSHGANPANVSFVTGLGVRRPLEVVHQVAQNDRRALPPSGLPVGNVQERLPVVGWYGESLRAQSLPPDGTAAGAYAFYDRWADVFDTLTEPTIATLTRGLAATASLMARTPAATQPWRAARAEVEAEAGGGVRLRVEGLDPRDATVVWESPGSGPVVSPSLGGSPAGAGAWTEAEAVWPDGRRVFAVSDAAAR